MTSLRRRPTPLRVGGTEHPDDDRPQAEEEKATPTPPTDPDGARIGHDVSARTRTEEDRRSFVSAVRSLRSGTGLLNLSERTLMVVGGVLAPLGLLFVLLGWVGAARTPNLFEQIPYMISGGLFGLGLVFLGAFFYFAHWITELVKENRAQSAALLDAIEGLRQEFVTASQDHSPGGPAAAGDASTPLVATLRGSMVHRPDCVVVVGKDDVRAVSEDDSLVPCKLCEPFEPG